MKNPLINLDYPDPDVIRVDDTYYMASTTMHFMPGGAILKSYDLMNWELVSYVYDTLDDTEAQKLEGDKNIYGQGMWAPVIRYHKGTFYVLFVANDTQKTYLYMANDVKGPWKKQCVEGFYHDASLLFDDDDRIYIVYGNKQIYLTELNSELTAPKEGGLHRIIVEDKDHPSLGYEGAHIYKINGKYYVFFIHSLRDRWFRTEACFMSESLEGEFKGGDVLQDDMGYRGAGVAQGGIVDTPDGKWYGILFQDRGAVGRIPVLVPVTWKNDYPVFGYDGKVPAELEVESTRPDYVYEPLFASDDFRYEKNEDGEYEINKVWQWNHNPRKDLISFDAEKGALRLTSGKICDDLTKGYNTITQRAYDPYSEASVTIDASAMNEGDYAGICLFQGLYGAVTITKTGEEYELLMIGKEAEDLLQGQKPAEISCKIYDRVKIDNPVVRLYASFSCDGDVARFYYEKDGEKKEIGDGKKLCFMLDHFTGCRYGLFYYSTVVVGGGVDFILFNYTI